MPDRAMGWLVEQGIAEERAILLAGDAIVAARLHWPGPLAAGQVEDARLISRAGGSSRGTALFTNGEQALVDRLPREAGEGAPIRLEVTRPALAEKGRAKLAQARPSALRPRAAPGLAEALRAEGQPVRAVHRFPLSGWDELLGEAFTRQIAFSGGQIVFSPTPAMTLIDVDGTLPPPALAMAAVPAIAAALRRFDLGGSIGIDFPTLAEKADRRKVDEALAAQLQAWPHERTAMNGFGIVQIVARMARVPILHRLAADPAGAAARLLLRRAEMVAEPGALLLSCPPEVAARLEPSWLEELARRTGRPVRLEQNVALAPEGSFAQAIPS